jgi:hypothetical protein
MYGEVTQNESADRSNLQRRPWLGNYDLED